MRALGLYFIFQGLGMVVTLTSGVDDMMTQKWRTWHPFPAMRSIHTAQGKANMHAWYSKKHIFKSGQTCPNGISTSEGGTALRVVVTPCSGRWNNNVT